jgi:hypothetical protein
MSKLNRHQVNPLEQSGHRSLVWHDTCDMTWNLVTGPRHADSEVWETDGGYFMKTGTTLVTTLFALATFPLVAQQPSSSSQPTRPTTQQSPSETEPASRTSPAASPETPALEMSPVNVELVSKLDSKTAKVGDSVVVQTKASVKTADGTEIPKGSKLVGHVLGAKPSAPGENSQGGSPVRPLRVEGRAKPRRPFAD